MRKPPSGTRWLAHERDDVLKSLPEKSLRDVGKSLPVLVSRKEETYDETGDAKAHGIATLLTKYTTVVCIYMSSDVVHTMAKLQGNLQAKKIDLASVFKMVNSTIKWLKELKKGYVVLVHGSRITYFSASRSPFYSFVKYYTFFLSKIT